MENEKHDYTEFDKRLLSLIEAGKNTATTLTAALDAEAKHFMARPGTEFRVVDRRLQALRKKGVIAWERRGAVIAWKLA